MAVIDPPTSAKIGSGNVTLMIARGRELLLSYRHEEALAQFERTAGQAPDDPAPIAWQITTLSRMYQFDRAISLGTKALTRFPKSVQIRVALGRVIIDSDRPAAGRPHFESAVKLDRNAMGLRPK
jgi:tetratricopeptide (TPR) repeat protein